ncbi:MAG: hypothetical protein DMF70_12775 [Acidobacteria bacterium]|nr:MAG: hypothetical protein DMF70_12775 [Acidobacteriota bacterium]
MKGISRRKVRNRQLAITLIFRCVVLLALCAFTASDRLLAQSKSAESEALPFCSRSNAIDSIRQQIDVTKTIDDSTHRIAVLIRAADLLWPLQQEKARAAFTEAFELATENEKENEQKGPRSVLLRMRTPDQRYVVIRAVAKRDSAWAKELTRQMLKVDTRDGESSSTRDSFRDVLTAERLLDSAIQLLVSDIKGADDLANASLNYPASSGLTRFLYRLAEVNQQGADQFYAQALAVYGQKPLREYLYLEAYPFALPEAIDTPIFASYVVPANFVANQSLQRRFVESMLRRAQQALEAPLDEGDNYRTVYGKLMPGAAHLLQALMRIEPQVRASLPDFSAPLSQARERLLVSLSAETQNMLLQPGRDVSTTPEQTFDEQIESAQKLPNVNDREDVIATAVLSAASDKQSLASVIRAIDKISNSYVRVPLLEWFYFRRAATAVKDRKFDEAERLASQVEGQEQRAYLHTEIARGSLNQSETQTHARELLEVAIAEANKAGMTIFAARTLLTASNLYTKIDMGRSISVLADAINCINHIEAPDFSSDNQALVKNVERKVKGGHYALRFYMPGHDPESAFRELGKIDFNDALTQTAAFTDKFQRVMTTLAVADVCLQETERRRNEKPKKVAQP